MSWSSSARLQALNPHSSFAFTPDVPKQPNPLHAGSGAAGGQYSDHVRAGSGATVDFSRTIPLSELMAAEQMGKTQQAHYRGRAVSAAGMRSTMQAPLHATLARTQDLTATMGVLPVKVPKAYGYTAALDAVHASRADRLVRLAPGWSQAEANAKALQRHEEKEQSIAVYNERIHNEMIAESEEARAAAHRRERARTSALANRQRPSTGESGSDPMAGTRRPRSHGGVSSTSDRAALHAEKLTEFWGSVAEQKDRLASRLADRMARRHAREEEAFAAMLGKLDENKELLAEIEEYLGHAASQDERRRDQLYKAWCTQVYAPMQAAIADGLANRDTSAIEARRVRLFNDFLRASNAKARGLYNDSAVDDYDPLEARQHAMKVRVGPLADPLKAGRQATESEWSLHKTFHPSATRIEHQTKPCLLPPPIWAKYRIESTPHGRYSLLKGNVSLPVGKRLVDPPAQRDTNNVGNSFDHYTYSTDARLARQQFFPRGGKRTEGYSTNNDPHGYDILASTEPSIRARFEAREASAAVANGGAASQQQQQQQQPSLPAISPSHFTPTPSRFVESPMTES